MSVSSGAGPQPPVQLMCKNCAQNQITEVWKGCVVIKSEPGGNAFTKELLQQFYMEYFLPVVYSSDTELPIYRQLKDS